MEHPFQERVNINANWEHGESKARASESRRKQMKAIERLRARKNESKLAHGWLMNSGNQTKLKPFSLDN